MSLIAKGSRNVFSIISYILQSLLNISTKQCFTKVCGSYSWGFNAKYEKRGALVGPCFLIEQDKGGKTLHSGELGMGVKLGR